MILRATPTQRLVILKVRARGLPRNAPLGRHWRIYVDGHADRFSAGTVGVARMTRPGRHRIYVALARNDNILVRPLVRSRAMGITVPQPGGPIVAAAGDIACDPASAYFKNGRGSPGHCHERATSNLLVHAGLNAVLALGDLQYECGSQAAFARSYDPSWGRVKQITHPAVGNHEYHTFGSEGCAAGANGYFSYWGSAAGEAPNGYYSFDIGAWHIIALNSNCSEIAGCGAGSPEERWLRADLAAHADALCTLAYWHHPPFSSGVTHGSTHRLTPLTQALYEGGADILLNGHEHNYERFAPQTAEGIADPVRGIREFVVGTGGDDLRPIGSPIANSELRHDKTFGVLELTLRPTSYAWQFIPEAGATFTDSGSSPCH